MATESDNVNSGALGTLLAVGAISTLGIALVVTALVRTETAEEAEKKDVSQDRVYRDLVAEQTAQLNAPAAYKDRGRGLVSLPLERAMELTVSGLAKDPSSATPPPPVGGSGGTGGAGEAATGGSGGSGGSASAEAAPAPGATPPEEKGAEGDKPKDDKEGAKDKKKEAPKHAPVAPKQAPAAPVPVVAPHAAPTNVPNAPNAP